jgi:futalosine hydrolase
MKVAIVAATEKEILLIKEAINPEFFSRNKRLKVSFIESGVGILISCFSILQSIYEQEPDLIIQAGIAGTFDTTSELGKVVIVKDEIIADTGVEEDGGFKDVFDLGLSGVNSFPFSDKKLINPSIDKLNFLQHETVTGITINEITTRLERIEQYKTKYNPAIETMEGASLHYCCLKTEVSFIQVRAISNYIGERDKSKWNFQSAFKNLSDDVLLYLDHLYQTN